MFVDKRRRKSRSYILVTLLLIILSTAFGIGYFLNYNGSENINKNNPAPQSNLQIPDSLKTSAAKVDTVDTGSGTDNADTAASMTDKGLITPNTKIRFITYFTLCGHTIEKDITPNDDEVNMTEEQYCSRYPGWEATRFDSEEVIMRKQLDTNCPKHYIIGIQDGFIAIFVYNENGEKVLKEKTDISISTLTPEDQKSLESGIIADTEDDLELKLEGFSD